MVIDLVHVGCFCACRMVFRQDVWYYSLVLVWKRGEQLHGRMTGCLAGERGCVRIFFGVGVRGG